MNFSKPFLYYIAWTLFCFMGVLTFPLLFPDSDDPIGYWYSIFLISSWGLCNLIISLYVFYRWYQRKKTA